MPFINQGKANIKYLLIVGLVAAVAGGIIFVAWNNYQKEIIDLNNFSEIKKAEIVECDDDYLKNNNALDYVYEIYDDRVDVTGSFKEGNIYYGQKTMSMEVGDKFFLPNPLNKNFSMKLEKIKKEGAYFLFNNPETPSCRFFVERIVPKLRESFSYPYPVTYRYNHTATHFFDFSLTGISLGERTVPSFVSRHSLDYKPGKEIYALTLYLKINNVGRYGAGVCLSNTFRLLLNEEGDLQAPINSGFNADCLYDDQTYFDQEVIFIVPETQKAFTITTGGEAKIFFTVTVLDNNQLKVEKSYE